MYEELERMQLQRQEEAAARTAREAEERRARAAAERQEKAQQLEAQRRAQAEEQRARGTAARPSSGSSQPGGGAAPDPERDVGGGWTAREQAALQAAMRRYPAYEGDAEWNRRERWAAIAAEVPGRSTSEVLQRCRQLQAAVRKLHGPPLLRLGSDALLSLLELLGGADLCACGRVCKELKAACRDDSLWLPLANELPEKWAFDAQERHIESNRSGSPASGGSDELAARTCT